MPTWTTFAPVSRFCPAPANVTPSNEAVFYLMSRGMSEEDARALIVSGFADNVSKELPVEYAVEMNNLIRLEMKGSIG